MHVFFAAQYLSPRHGSNNASLNEPAGTATAAVHMESCHGLIGQNNQTLMGHHQRRLLHFLCAARMICPSVPFRKRNWSTVCIASNHLSLDARAHVVSTHRRIPSQCLTTDQKKKGGAKGSQS